MKSLSGIKTITFDVDNTRRDFETVMRRGLKASLDELTKLDPGAAPLLDIERMIQIRLEVFDKL
ncbi:MAG: hypothetical protein JW763_02710 [candidate division Zixibacteria bacterium]|nr:hypothetical protein [candidate division Zixibacteria bacterium]